MTRRSRLRFRVIDCRYHKDTIVRAWGHHARTIFLHLLACGFDRGIPGVLNCSAHQLAQIIGWSENEVITHFREIEKDGRAYADWKAELVFIPNRVYCDEPRSPDNVRSWAMEWEETAECLLKTKVWEHVRSYCESRGEEFLAAFLDVISEPKATHTRPMPDPSRTPRVGDGSPMVRSPEPEPYSERERDDATPQQNPTQPPAGLASSSFGDSDSELLGQTNKSSDVRPSAGGERSELLDPANNLGDLLVKDEGVSTDGAEERKNPDVGGKPTNGTKSKAHSAYPLLDHLLERWNARKELKQAWEFGVIDVWPERQTELAVEARRRSKSVEELLDAFVEEAAGSGIVRGDRGNRRRKRDLKFLLGDRTRFWELLGGAWSDAKEETPPAPKQVIGRANGGLWTKEDHEKENARIQAFERAKEEKRALRALKEQQSEEQQ